MTIIKATCPCCGDVELTREVMRLVVHPVKERSFYSFTCPTCQDMIRKPAGAEVIRLLKLGGVEPERVDMPAEALEVHNGAALTQDDLLDFCRGCRARPRSRPPPGWACTAASTSRAGRTSRGRGSAATSEPATSESATSESATSEWCHFTVLPCHLGPGDV